MKKLLTITKKILFNILMIIMGFIVLIIVGLMWAIDRVPGDKNEEDR